MDGAADRNKNPSIAKLAIIQRSNIVTHTFYSNWIYSWYIQKRIPKQSTLVRGLENYHGPHIFESFHSFPAQESLLGF